MNFKFISFVKYKYQKGDNNKKILQFFFLHNKREKGRSFIVNHNEKYQSSEDGIIYNRIITYKQKNNFDIIFLIFIFLLLLAKFLIKNFFLKYILDTFISFSPGSFSNISSDKTLQNILNCLF